MRGLGELPEKAEATQCPRSLLRWLRLEMGPEGWWGLDGCEVELHTEEAEELWAWAEELEGEE